VEKSERNKLNAILRLLDDTDPIVSESILKGLLSIGSKAIDALEKRWETEKIEEIQSKIEQYISGIHFNDCCGNLFRWQKNKKNKLIDGILLLCQFQYPGIKPEKLLSTIEKLKKELSSAMKEFSTLEKRIFALTHVLFLVHRFKLSSESALYKPSLHFINEVVHSKQAGVSVLVSLMILCQNSRLIKIEAISGPWGLLLKFSSTNPIREPYYMNVADFKTLIPESAFKQSLKGFSTEYQQHYLKPLRNHEFLAYCMDEISEVFLRNDKIQKANQFRVLASICRGHSSSSD
jgi:regulator of sirC expression with transglutaminase-like and TPR domain